LTCSHLSEQRRDDKGKNQSFCQRCAWDDRLAASEGVVGEHPASVVWVTREGDTVLFSTASHRQKARNLARDPRISVSVFDIENPYESVEIRGTAELVEDEGRTLPRVLSHKYLGEDPPAEPDVIRLIVRVSPDKVTNFSA